MGKAAAGADGAEGAAWWRRDGDAIVVMVRVTTGGRRSEVLDSTGDRLRVRVAARPVEGQANAEVARFLAELCGVRRNAVTIVGGPHSRDKVVRIAGVSRPPAGLPRRR